VERTTRSRPTRYVAFLRGINVGGHKPVRMAELAEAFAGLGLANVRTVLASGNVLFDARPSSRKTLAARISAGLKQALGLDATVVLRTLEEIRLLLDSDPFKALKPPARAQLYITFLAEDAPTNVPLPRPTANIRIARLSTGELASVVVLSPGIGTPDLMTALDKQLGRKATTRNWNTVRKLWAGELTASSSQPTAPGSRRTRPT
jgi:uncharacterized protein (DUF1697 family)